MGVGCLAPAGPVRVAVLGDLLGGGNHAGNANEDVGATAGTAADWVIALGEYADRVVHSARKAGLPDDHAVVAGDVEEAVALIRPLLSALTKVLTTVALGVV